MGQQGNEKKEKANFPKDRAEEKKKPTTKGGKGVEGMRSRECSKNEFQPRCGVE